MVRYRPITLIVVLAKAVEAVIKSIAEEGQDGGGKKLHPSVMGFVKGKGGHLAIFNLVETVHSDSLRLGTGSPGTRGHTC